MSTTKRTGRPLALLRFWARRVALTINVAAALTRLERSSPGPSRAPPDSSAISTTTIRTSTRVRPRAYRRERTVVTRLLAVVLGRGGRALGDGDVVLGALLLVRARRNHGDLVVRAHQRVGLAPGIIGVLA